MGERRKIPPLARVSSWMRKTRGRWTLVNTLVSLLWLALGLSVVPHRVCERDADAWYRGDPETTEKLARSVSRWVDEPLDPSTFATGSRRYDGEWLFGTYMMAAMGEAQTAIERPERRIEARRRVAKAIDRLLEPGARAWDREAWGEDPIDTLATTNRGHVAYLGYLGLALGMERALGDAKHARLHDAVVAAIARRLAGPELLETYPGEIYPVDNAAAIGALGLHDRTTGGDHRARIARYARTIRQKHLDRGLLVQAVGADGRPGDRARASGTALGAYFVSFADEDLSRDLFLALRRELYETVLGFGAVREYPRGATGRGDIDSGPIVLGYGVSGTGFALAPSRLFADEDAFRSIYGTVHLFGAPRVGARETSFTTGGPLGDAILLAMLTATRVPATLESASR